MTVYGGQLTKERIAGALVWLSLFGSLAGYFEYLAKVGEPEALVYLADNGGPGNEDEGRGERQDA